MVNISIMMHTKLNVERFEIIVQMLRSKKSTIKGILLKMNYMVPMICFIVKKVCKQDQKNMVTHTEVTEKKQEQLVKNYMEKNTTLKQIHLRICLKMKNSWPSLIQKLLRQNVKMVLLIQLKKNLSYTLSYVQFMVKMTLYISMMRIQDTHLNVTFISHQKIYLQSIMASEHMGLTHLMKPSQMIQNYLMFEKLKLNHQTFSRTLQILEQEEMLLNDQLLRRTT